MAIGELVKKEMKGIFKPQRTHDGDIEEWTSAAMKNRRKAKKGKRSERTHSASQRNLGLLKEKQNTFPQRKAEIGGRKGRQKRAVGRKREKEQFTS